MIRRRALLTTTFLFTILLLSISAWALPCNSYVPRQMTVGESACISVCSDSFAYPAIDLFGDFNGPDAMPILVLLPGCNSATTHCNENCTAITPPTFPFAPDPYYPSQYYGESDCIFMYLYWVHDNVWWLEIYAPCSGCFCLTWDHQLSVAMRAGLSATEGNGQVDLTWATASETDNDHFEIARDGQPAANIPGLVNSPTGRDYSWTDSGMENGLTHTYTLTAVNVNNGRQLMGTVTATPRSTASVQSYALYQNYPNPFNPQTTIAFDLVEGAPVDLKVFNPLGSRVTTLISGPMEAGHHAIAFDGSHMTSGLYFYTLTVGDRFTATRKMLLVK